VAVVTARSEREAHDKAEAYRELLLTDVIRRYLLGEQSGMDFADVDLDGPLPDIAPDQPDVNGPLLARWQELSRTQGLSVRQIADTILSRPPVVGTPAQIADHFEHWVDTKASDGFLLTPTVFPNDLEDFVDLVVPELQARGRFRTAYTGTTLREHLQIARPTGQWARPSTLVAADA
jgi:alkanesulfonate monooxygenase SsuD/methylene tetrahydromethanopterin reductase-like flavin-dependent oxidoreductase (luciferase family)